jgi:hypothetical protein
MTDLLYGQGGKERKGVGDGREKDGLPAEGDGLTLAIWIWMRERERILG